MRWTVVLSTALALASLQKGQAHGLQAAGGLHKARAQDDPLAYKAWSFVRGISTELGEQTQGVLGVQNNLEAVEMNVTAEQQSWEEKKQVLMQQRTVLEADLARAQEEQRAAAKLAEHAQLLRSQLADEVKTKGEVEAQTCAENDQREAEAQKNLASVSQLQGRLSAARAAATQAAAAQFSALRTVKTAVADLESQVYAQVQLLRTLQQQSAAKAAVRAQGQAEILKQNIVTQKTSAHLEAQLLSETQRAVHVQHLERQAAVLSQQTKDTASRVVTETESCDAEAKGLEDQVRAIQAEYAQQAHGIRACQAADAEGQRLTAKLASCR